MKPNQYRATKETFRPIDSSKYDTTTVSDVSSVCEAVLRVRLCASITSRFSDTTRDPKGVRAYRCLTGVGARLFLVLIGNRLGLTVS